MTATKDFRNALHDLVYAPGALNKYRAIFGKGEEGAPRIFHRDDMDRLGPFVIHYCEYKPNRKTQEGFTIEKDQVFVTFGSLPRRKPNIILGGDMVAITPTGLLEILAEKAAEWQKRVDDTEDDFLAQAHAAKYSLLTWQGLRVKNEPPSATLWRLMILRERGLLYVETPSLMRQDEAFDVPRRWREQSDRLYRVQVRAPRREYWCLLPAGTRTSRENCQQLGALFDSRDGLTDAAAYLPVGQYLVGKVRCDASGEVTYADRNWDTLEVRP